MGDWTPATWRYLGSVKCWVLLSLSGLVSGCGSGCWTLSFSYTTVAHSYLFNRFSFSIPIWNLSTNETSVTGERRKE